MKCSRVPTSVMPKGVEHIDVAGAWDDLTRVPTSVMPKGVEHTDPASAPNTALVLVVPTSVMPKGVEHGVLGSILLDDAVRADLCDAERR